MTWRMKRKKKTEAYIRMNTTLHIDWTVIRVIGVCRYIDAFNGSNVCTNVYYKSSCTSARRGRANVSCKIIHAKQRWRATLYVWQWKGTVFVIELGLEVVISRSHVLNRVLSLSLAITSLYIIFYSNWMNAAAAVTASAVHIGLKRIARRNSGRTKRTYKIVLLFYEYISIITLCAIYVFRTYNFWLYVRWRKCT